MKQKQVSDSCERGASVYVDVPINPSWLGGYYVKYDGKYISLYGTIEAYEWFTDRNERQTDKLLLPIALEIRDAEDWTVGHNDDFVRITINPPPNKGE